MINAFALAFHCSLFPADLSRRAVEGPPWWVTGSLLFCVYLRKSVAKLLLPLPLLLLSSAFLRVLRGKAFAFAVVDAFAFPCCLWPVACCLFFLAILPLLSRLIHNADEHVFQ